VYMSGVGVGEELSRPDTAAARGLAIHPSHSIHLSIHPSMLPERACAVPLSLRPPIMMQKLLQPISLACGLYLGGAKRSGGLAAEQAA